MMHYTDVRLELDRMLGDDQIDAYREDTTPSGAKRWTVGVIIEGRTATVHLTPSNAYAFFYGFRAGVQWQRSSPHSLPGSSID